MDRRRALVPVLVAILISVAACGQPSGSWPSAPSVTASPASVAPASPTASPSTASPSPAPLTRSTDLTYLVDRLRANHPNPFLDEGEAAFLARVEALRAQADRLTDLGFLVGVMRLMGGRERDGHSGAWAMAQDGRVLRALPVWLWDFPDGPRIVAAQDPADQDLIGARVTRVGHATLDEAEAAVDPIVPRDNASSRRGYLPIYLTLPDVAVELGLRVAGEPALTLELLDGTTRAYDPDPVPIETLRDWIFGVYDGDFPDGLPPDPDGPLFRRDTTRPFWTTALKGGGLYVAYNVIARSDGQGGTIAALAETVRATIDAADPRLIVDLRNDGGGDNTTYRPLREAVHDAALAHPGQVALITGRGTFSAAGNFVTELKVGDAGGAIRLVGEAPGGGLDMYGDVIVVRLPASGVVVLVSTRFHNKAPGDPRLAIDPDIPVEVTWDDYAAGRDPVLSAAIAATAGG